MNNNKYTKKAALITYTEAAKIYNEYLNNKDILIISKNKKELNYHEISFKASNFLHLTGTKTNLSPAKFFNNALDNRLSVNDFEFKDSFFTFKKIDVLKMAMEFPYNSMTIGEYNAPKVQLKADIGAGNLSYVLTFRYENKNDNHKLYPVGLNKDDIRDTTDPKFPIVAILSKSSNKKVYDRITYQSKNIKFNGLFMPKELISLLSDKVISEIKPNIIQEQKSITINEAILHQQPEIVSIDDFDFIDTEEIAATSERVAKSSNKEQIKSLKDIIHFFSEKKNKNKTPKVDNSTQSPLEPKQQERVSIENKRSGYSSFPTVNRPSDTKDTQSKERKKDNPSL